MLKLNFIGRNFDIYIYIYILLCGLNKIILKTFLDFSDRIFSFCVRLSIHLSQRINKIMKIQRISYAKFELCILVTKLRGKN